VEQRNVEMDPGRFASIGTPKSMNAATPDPGGFQIPDNQQFAVAGMEAAAGNAAQVQQLQTAIEDAARRLQWLSANGAHPNQLFEAQNQLQDLQGRLMQMQNSATTSWAERASRLEGSQGAGSMGINGGGGKPSPTRQRAQQVSQNELARIMNMFGEGGSAGPLSAANREISGGF